MSQVIVSFNINCWGLKPNTSHEFLIEGVLYNPSQHGTIGMISGQLSGSNIITDGYGNANFTIYPPTSSSGTGLPSYNLSAPGSRAQGRFNQYALAEVGTNVQSSTFGSTSVTYL